MSLTSLKQVSSKSLAYLTISKKVSFKSIRCLKQVYECLHMSICMLVCVCVRISVWVIECKYVSLSTWVWSCVKRKILVFIVQGLITEMWPFSHLFILHWNKTAYIAFSYCALATINRLNILQDGYFKPWIPLTQQN